VVFALVGAAACVTAIARFVFRVLWNGLAWHPDLPVRDYYLAVGESYAQGFVAGFFFCFFLALAAIALGSWSGRPGPRGAVPARAAGEPEVESA
jgi:hypothetical protein